MRFSACIRPCRHHSRTVNSALPTAFANSCVVYHSRTCCRSTRTWSIASILSRTPSLLSSMSSLSSRLIAPLRSPWQRVSDSPSPNRVATASAFGVPLAQDRSPFLLLPLPPVRFRAILTVFGSVLQIPQREFPLLWRRRGPIRPRQSQGIAKLLLGYVRA